MKQVIIAVLAVVAIISGAVLFGKDKAVNGESSSHIYGKADSAVTLVEFGDFECPACKFFYPVVEQIKEEYKDRISFQFRHLPIVNSHRNALAAHRAAEAAGRQGKFWEMYNQLYENQEDWNGPSQVDPAGITTTQAIQVFEQYAQVIGLDMDKYRIDVNDSSTIGVINADTAAAKSDFQASGTPTFILNGKKIEDTSSINTFEGFSALIDKAISESTQQ